MYYFVVCLQSRNNSTTNLNLYIMKKTESKCHAFWLTNRNPITMKKCSEENLLHEDNQSKHEQNEEY